ncbi:hypothetical protein ACFFX0_17280 [Citricoccus parietis]|uniref:Uncharacterized protein n=1 Tax=Citricoccus parietis TaxID=592307 RepID=A0ABV5G1P3_9MICC
MRHIGLPRRWRPHWPGPNGASVRARSRARPPGRGPPSRCPRPWRSSARRSGPAWLRRARCCLGPLTGSPRRSRPSSTGWPRPSRGLEARWRASTSPPRRHASPRWPARPRRRLTASRSPQLSRRPW